MADNFYKQLGIGVSSVTFGVMLAVFIFTAGMGNVNSPQAVLLFATSFLLTISLWWQHSDLFVKSLQSHNVWHFVFDFAVSFLGIMAVIFVNDLQIWLLIGIMTMLSSAVRCMLQWDKSSKAIKSKLKETFFVAVGLSMILDVIYIASYSMSGVFLSVLVFIIALIFVAHPSIK